MSIASPPASLASATPAVPANAPAPAAPVAAAIGAPATGTPPANGSEADSPTAQFQRALQRLMLGSATLAGTAAGSPLVAGDATYTGTDPGIDAEADAGQEQTVAAVSDLVLSGMLVVPVAPPPLPDSATATPAAAPHAPLAITPPRAPLSPAAATLLASTSGAVAALAPPVPVPTNAIAAGLDAAAASPATLAVSRFSLPPGAPDEAADAAGASDTAAPAPLRPRAAIAAALAPLAAQTTDALPGRDYRSASAAPAPQGSETAPGIAVAASSDAASRDAGLPGTAAGTGVRGPHSLLETLGDRIALQLQRGGDRTVIRLDPPMQGQLEITIHRDASGATQVHLNASNSDVARQLQTISDSLRQELVHRQPGEVTVVVSHGAREQDGRQRQQTPSGRLDDPGRALTDADDAQSSARFALTSHLD